MKNIKLLVLAFFILFGIQLQYSQNGIDKALKKYNKETIPYISTQNAAKLKKAVFLDAREPKEYNISHINNAKFIGHKTFQKRSLSKLKLNKNDIIIVYCSIGVRSEQIGEKIKALGYKNVYNLYGGIFKWKNEGKTIVNKYNKPTEKIHGYDKIWSKYIKKGKKIIN